MFTKEFKCNAVLVKGQWLGGRLGRQP